MIALSINFQKILRTVLVFGITFMAVETMAQKGLKYNRVIAHRGAWKNTDTPQNSIASLKEAIKLGCYGSEFDVHLSGDSVVYLSHDHTIQGVALEKATTAEIEKIRLKNGEPLPTLEAFLKAGKGQKSTRMVLEIKASQISKERTLALTRLCVKMVSDMKLKKIVDYISFDYDACKLIAQLDPKANIAYLTGDKAPAVVAADKINGLDYNQAVYRKNENWIKEAKDLGLTINVWTVNSKEMIAWYVDRQVDFITTDEPELLLDIVKKK